LRQVFGITDSNFDNLAALIVFCNLTSLYPLFFIGWLDRVGEKSEEELETANVVDSSTAEIEVEIKS